MHSNRLRAYRSRDDIAHRFKHSVHSDQNLASDIQNQPENKFLEIEKITKKKRTNDHTFYYCWFTNGQRSWEHSSSLPSTLIDEYDNELKNRLHSNKKRRKRRYK